MRKNARISIEKDKYDKVVNDIREYFSKERDEEIGSLQASMLLDFFIESAGSEIYNQAIVDMQKYLSEKVDDMYGFML